MTNKLTKDALKGFIREVLSEATQNVQYNRIMAMLAGDVENIDQLAILTPENPKSQKISDKQNEARAKAFEKEMSQAGYGFRIVSGMYDRPEDSYLIPHMSLEDAAKYSYKYGQESFIHTQRQDTTKGAPAMQHQMYYIDYSNQKADPSYDSAEFGEILIPPSPVPLSQSFPSTSVSDDTQLATTPNYYSHVPHKKWDEKDKGGETKPAGEKLGKKFSIDFFNDDAPPLSLSEPEDELKNPRYIREAKYIFINKNDVPNNLEAKKLAEEIEKLSKQIVETNRLGSSKFYGRMRMRKMKLELKEIVEKK